MARPLYKLTYIPHTDLQLHNLPRKQGMFYHREDVSSSISSEDLRDRLVMAIEDDLLSERGIYTRHVTSRASMRQFISRGVYRAVVSPENWLANHPEVVKDNLVIAPFLARDDVYIYGGSFPYEVNLLSWPTQGQLIYTLQRAEGLMRVNVPADTPGGAS